MNCACNNFNPPEFQPAINVISSVTISYPAQVTTTIPHLYVNRTIVRLVIPAACGMQQANNLTGTIFVTGANTFNINIDTRTFDPFAIPVAPAPWINTCAQVIPVGEDNSTLDAAAQNVLV
jgi:hypothetical protein